MLLHTMNGEQRSAALRLALCGSLFVAPFSVVAQNLVPNPSFEEYVVCPDQPGFLNTSQPTHWYEWDQSPEYFNACAGELGGTDTLMDVPTNGMTYQYAFDGQAYVGTGVFMANEYREHFGAELLTPLTPGQTYYASMRVNLAMGGTYWDVAWACNNIGMLFTMDEHLWSGSTEPEFAPRNYAQVYSSEIVTDTANWVLVSGSFVADSAYNYVVLGNFFDNANTDTLILGAPSSAAYYLFDDVCVSLSPSGCALETQVIEEGAEAVSVFPNPAEGVLDIILPLGAYELRVTDMIGRICFMQLVSGAVVHLDVIEWGGGQYFVEVNNSAGERWNCSFVVMH